MAQPVQRNRRIPQQVESLGPALGIPAGPVEGDLKHFKEFIERRGSATGAWRGEVAQDDVAGSRAAGSTSDTERELAGAATMGASGSSGDLGSNYAAGARSSDTDTATGGLSGYEGDYATGTTTGTTGTGDVGSGLNNPQDLGTGRRENDSSF